MSFNDDASWTILSNIEQSIKVKIEQHGVKLKDWDVNIYRGVLTGYNDAFIISGERKDALIEKDPKSAELIRPILRGRDIKRYGYYFADLWLINVHNGIKDKNIPRIQIDDYPAIKEHLDLYYEKLAKRSDRGETPYNLRNCAYMDDFNKQKIVWGEISDKPKFSIDLNGEFVAEATTFLMVGDHLKYLLCFLNSTLSEYFFAKYGTTTGMGTLRWKKYLIELLPIPVATTENETTLIKELDALLSADLEGKERHIQRINDTIYSMFGFNLEEIEFIENAVKHGAH